MTVNQITVVGNLTRKPELRSTASGILVADLRVAENYRRLDRGSGEWRDVASTYYVVTCWRSLAQYVTETLDRGHPVIVVGRLYNDEWVDQDGTPRRTLKIDPSSVGLDLRFFPAWVPKRPPSSMEETRQESRKTGGPWTTASEEPVLAPAAAIEPPLDDEEPEFEHERELAAVPASGH